MIYNHLDQYRCAIVRGKASSDLDNLLPAYAGILQELCPCTQETFRNDFDSKLMSYLPNSTQKTLDNHRTEIAGKLFGMYYEDSYGFIHISERTLKLLEDSDQISFFKDLCLAYQFPSGMNKPQTLQEHLKEHISIRQLCFLMNVLLLCHKQSLFLSKKQIGYYVLNSKDVLRGKAKAEEVFLQIQNDFSKGIQRSIPNPNNKEASYVYQHINEQLNLLFLANLILFENGVVYLNEKELKFIQEMASQKSNKLLFDFYKYNFSSVQDRKECLKDWDYYFGKLSNLEVDQTLIENIIITPTKPTEETTVAIGDEGEEYVYELERSRIKERNPRLLNKVKKLGRIKGIGFDIQSVYGEGDFPDFAKYIEVKTTKRVTPPTQTTFQDTINLTRNEWIAAQQHSKDYFIYRLYIFQGGVRIFVIENPYKASQTGKLKVIPLTFRLDFDQNSGRFYA